MQDFGVDTKRTKENTDLELAGRRQGPGKFHRAEERERRYDCAGLAAAKAADQLTVDQYRDFTTMVKSLDNNGRRAKEIEVAGKREAFNEVIDKAAKNL